MAATNFFPLEINGTTIDANRFNLILNLFKGAFVGHDQLGQIKEKQELGTDLIPWGNIYGDKLIIDKTIIDFSSLESPSNSIISGQVRPNSQKSDFIRANGVINEATILATTTDLVVQINSDTISIDTDIVISGLISAPSTNNTVALIPGLNAFQQIFTKFIGDHGETVPVTSIGSNVALRDGQIIALQKPTGSEILIGTFSNSESTLTGIKRGFFFNSTGGPIKREIMAEGFPFILMELGWIFIENFTILEVSYRTPVYSFTSPPSPQEGDYWLDFSLNNWKRYDGAEFVLINRTLIGLVVIDENGVCLGSRSFDFQAVYSPLNSYEFDDNLGSLTQVISKSNDNSISVNAKKIEQRGTFMKFDITTDRDTGVTEGNSKLYFGYITEKGERKISDESPYYIDFFQGFYHPYESWRCVMSFLNDVSLNISSVNTIKNNNFKVRGSPKLHRNGMIISHDPLDPLKDIIIQPGLVRSIDDSIDIKSTKPVTKKLDASYQIGSDQGGLPSNLTITANTVYHVFALGGPSGVIDFGFDTSITAANLIQTDSDSVFPTFRRIGSVITDAGFNIIQFTQTGDEFQYVSPINDINANPSPNITPTLTVPQDVEIEVFIRGSAYDSNNFNDAFLLFRSLSESNSSVAVGTNSSVGSGKPTGNAQNVNAYDLSLRTNTSGQIFIETSDTVPTFFIQTYKYRDFIGD